jgi:hypothetical protein
MTSISSCYWIVYWCHDNREKYLKKVQQREQHLLQKLAEARERQAGAMTRFAQAQARIALAEERLQALREQPQPAQGIFAPGAEPAVPSPQEALQPPEDEEALIAAILAITQTEPDSGDEVAAGTGGSVQQAEWALQEVKQAILNGALSGSEAEVALREAENALLLAQRAESAAHSSEMPGTSEPDTTARLPVIRRPQESK